MSTAHSFQLEDGTPVLVSIEDAELVRSYKWHILQGHNGKLYVVANTKPSMTYMHRLIAGTPRGMETDHINGNGLDNRRSNLRIATPSQNSANTGKPKRPNGERHTSQFKGVSWDKSRGKWQAKITVARKCRNLGRYEVEADAARAYDNAAVEAWGQFATLNAGPMEEAA